MARYVTMPRRPQASYRWEDTWCEMEVHGQPSVTVFESDEPYTDTGLMTPEGEAIMRMRDPIGFRLGDGDD